MDGTDWLVLIGVVSVIVLVLTLIAIIWYGRRGKPKSDGEAILVVPLPSESGKNIDTIPDPRNYPPNEADSLSARVPTNFGPPFRLTEGSKTVVPKATATSEAVTPKREVSTPVADRQTPASPKPKRRKPKPPPPAPNSAKWQDLMDETVTVPAGYGQHWATRFDLDGGDEIRGTLTEVDDDDFSYKFLDEANYAAYRAGDDYEVVDEAEETSSVRVDFSVDNADRYYLVLYAYGKQNDREVEVSLRTRTAR